MLDARTDLLRRTLVLLQKIDQKFMVLTCNRRFQRVPMENRLDELLGSPFGGEGVRSYRLWLRHGCSFLSLVNPSE